MAYRGGNRNRNFGGGNYGGGGGGMGGGRNMNPWDNQPVGGGYGSMRQGGGGQGMNAEALSLANNLLNNLLRNQNPPSLLDLPRGVGGGGGGGAMGNNRGPRGPMGNRAGGNRNNRRMQGGFGRGGQKTGSNNKQGGSIRKQNAFDRAKKLLAKNSNKKKDSTPGDKNDNSKKNESQKESIYADVPNDMFYCHLCKKHMWDSNSFENHIKGRTHLMMREGIEESYRLKANMIRQEAKIAEQLKSIELDRLKRMGKSGKSRQLEYCTMCDLNFHGHLSSHRKSEGHLQLKKFLHPKCLECGKEFPTRIEFDTHLLTPEHLKKAAEKNTKVGERKKNTLTILTEEDEIKDVRPPQKKKKKVEPKKDGEETAAGEKTDEKKEGDEAGTEIEGEKKEGEEGADETKEDGDLNETKDGEEEEESALAEDPEDCIIDFQDGDEIPIEVDAKLPKYNWTRPVGFSLISRLECYECSLCAKFFDTEKTAEVHSRTVSHHRQFLKFINDKSSDTKIAQKRAAAALEESERKKRKLEEAEDMETKKDENAEEKGELYDPSEATGDDEDVEMNEQTENGVVKKEDQQIDDVNGSATEIKEEADQTEKMETQEVEEKKAEIKVETTPAKASPQKKATPAPAAKAAPKATPRGRGRGRYNRY